MDRRLSFSGRFALVLALTLIVLLLPRRLGNIPINLAVLPGVNNHCFVIGTGEI